MVSGGCAVMISALAIMAPSAVASPLRGPCVAGRERPICRFVPARVVRVVDGDTVWVRLASDPRHRSRSVRVLGINAMELSRYSATPAGRRGACHAVEAANLAQRLIDVSGRRVRLASQRASSRTATRHRLRRSLWVRADGRWRDVGAVLVQAGLALPLSNRREWAHNREYRLLARDAMLARRGLYDPAGCGRGPDADLTPSLYVHPDADGDDERNLNGEWITVVNPADRPLALTGWWVQDSGLHPSAPGAPGYLFPAGTSVPARSQIRVHVGCGHRDGDLHWCRRSSVLENATHDRRHMGDGAFLFDPRGNVRAARLYPCETDCTDPLTGQITLSGVLGTRDLEVYNWTGAPIDLSGYSVRIGFRDLDQPRSTAEFPLGTLVPPRADLLVQFTYRYREPAPGVIWWRNTIQLTYWGGMMALLSPDDRLVACEAWNHVRPPRCHYSHGWQRISLPRPNPPDLSAALQMPQPAEG
jgi:micrococcal nuclease